MEQSIENFRKVYRMLADEESRYIYLNKLNFLISSESKYINKILANFSPSFSPMNRSTFADILNTIQGDEDIILYGTGRFPSFFTDEWRFDKRIAAFCSKNADKQKSGFFGLPVISPEELFSRRDVNVLVSTTDARDEILGILTQNGFPMERVYYFPDMKPHKIAPNQYFDSNIISLKDEVFIDAGCYDLETSLILRERCQNVKKVYAFEPDPESFQRCEKRKLETNYEQVELFPFGTWSKKDELSFCAEGTQSSALDFSEMDSRKITQIPVVAIDDVVKETDKITFIKLDVEGAEMESLKGAKKTIQKYHPKLAVCIYHKPEDMLAIPLYINSLVMEYKFYVRHYSNDVDETVLYAVIS